MPLDRKRNRRGAQHAKVICIVGVLPDILAIADKVASEALPEAGVEFIAEAGVKRRDRV